MRGIGKRSKKCHGAGQKINRHFRGCDAEKEMLKILKGNEAAQNLAREVASFYGNYLEFYEDMSYISGHYEIECGHEPVMLRSVSAYLHPKTPRTAEALSHELLHLRLPIQGFPLCERVNVPDELDEHAQGFIEAIQKIGNLIGHELIFNQFVGIGFDGSNFLREPSPVPNYEGLARKAVPSQGYITAVGFPWWCLEYYRHWISTRHGLPPDTMRYADSAAHWGSKVHSDLVDALSAMRDWIAGGEFKNPVKYPIEINKLLSIMKLPHVTGWAALRGKEPGKPVAVNLEINDENA